MVNRFMVVCQAILMGTMVLVTKPILGVTVAAEEKRPAEIGYVSVEKVDKKVFRITAKGIVPNPAWSANLHPMIYSKPPSTWEIEAIAIRSPVFALQPLTPWVLSIEMTLPRETQRISVKGTVKGAVQAITKPVPW